MPSRPASADVSELAGKPLAAPRALATGAVRTDRELVEAAQAGDSAAFGDLVRRHQGRVYQIAYHLLRSRAEAEDVTQETFVRGYRAIGRFDVQFEPATWLYRIAVNLSLNSIRDRKAKRYSNAADDAQFERQVFEGGPSAGGDPARTTHERQLAAVLCEGIDALSDTLRTTLLLVCVDGLEHQEVSEILGCPEGTVAWRVHEARRKLREYLEARGFGGEA